MNAKRFASFSLLFALLEGSSCSQKNATAPLARDAGGSTATRPADGGAGTTPQSDSGPDAAALGPDDNDDDLPWPPAAGVAPTPPMGWSSWNAFSSSISEQVIEQVATAMVTSGMKDAGYQYVNIDLGWMQQTRAPDGSMKAASTFPNGIQPVGAYVHNLGLKLGMYSDRGSSQCSCSATCSCNDGSQGHEAQDAANYAAWGADYFKYDNCCATLDIQTQYRTMGTALAATGRPIVYSLCAWQFYEWGIGVGNSWRTTSDITATWGSFWGNALITRYLAAYAGPFKYAGDPSSSPGASTAPNVAYGWNDPDMLEVGNGTLTDTENQTHFSLWAITAAPLIAGNDLRRMSPATASILTNKEVIALDQDALGLQGVPVRTDGSVWAKPLDESGARGVVLVNAGTAAADIGFQLTEIGLRAGAATVRDLVAHQDLGNIEDGYTVRLPSHGSATLKVAGVEPPRPHGTAYLSDLAWTYAANGLGNVHRDESDTSSQAVTGTAISLRGTKYGKGLGADGPSMVIYRLAKKCTGFTALVGVDDAATGAGSVVFQVWADGAKLFDSGTVTGMSAAAPVDVDLTGKRRLVLLATNAGDGNAQDRADWADAKVVCAP